MSDLPTTAAAAASNSATPGPSTTQRPGSTRRTEQDLIRDLYDAMTHAVDVYGSKESAARALKVSASMFTRISPGWLLTYSATGRLPRPHHRTLKKLSVSEINAIRQSAIELLNFRGHLA